jgi:hypothetical protein
MSEKKHIYSTEYLEMRLGDIKDELQELKEEYIVISATIERRRREKKKRDEKK